MDRNMQIDADDASFLRRKYGIEFYPRVRESVEVENAKALFEGHSQHLPCRFMPLGAYSYTRSFFAHVTRIGRYCSIGSEVQVMGHNHPVGWVSTSPMFYRHKRAHGWGSKRSDFLPFEDLGPPVEIENDVWIGDGVLLAHGVKLGTGSVIAARATVTRDVPPYAIVGGTPARVIRMRFDDATIERLLASEWWRWHAKAWDQLDPSDIMSFLAHADVLRDSVAPRADSRMTATDLLKILAKRADATPAAE